MKKKRAITILLLMVALAAIFFALTSPARADRSGQKTADAAITTKGGALAGILVKSGTTATVTMSVYDNATTNSGTKLMPDWVIPINGTGELYSVGFSIDPPMCPYYNGIYVDVTTDSVDFSYEVYYDPSR